MSARVWSPSNTKSAATATPPLPPSPCKGVRPVDSDRSLRPPRRCSSERCARRCSRLAEPTSGARGTLSTPSVPCASPPAAPLLCRLTRVLQNGLQGRGVGGDTFISPSRWKEASRGQTHSGRSLPFARRQVSLPRPHGRRCQGVRQSGPAPGWEMCLFSLVLLSSSLSLRGSACPCLCFIGSE